MTVEPYDQAPAPPAESTAPTRTVPPPQQPTDVEPPADTTPVPQLPPEPMPSAEQPAEEPDDLFGPTTTPTETPPAETTPLETTPPADATPPAETPEDDLFGPATEGTTPPAEPSGTAPSEPATPDTNIDDLFGPAATDPGEGAAIPSETDSTVPAGATPPAGGEEAAEAAEELFNSMYDVLREPGGLASNELRTWVDNTGKYSCRGRLIRFLDEHVRLLKENGRTTTVPLTRLGANDLQFVHRQASAQQLEAAGQLAQSLSTMQLLGY